MVPKDQSLELIALDFDQGVKIEARRPSLGLDRTYDAGKLQRPGNIGVNIEVQYAALPHLQGLIRGRPFDAAKIELDVDALRAAARRSGQQLAHELEH